MLRHSQASAFLVDQRQILRGVSLRLTMLALVGLVGLARAADAPLRQIAAIPLDPVDGRIDHFCIDRAGKRLFIAALGNNSVEVINVDSNKHTHHMPGMKEPQGVGYVPETKTLVVANGGDGKVHFYDTETFQLKSVAEDLDDADNVRTDANGDVYVGYGSGAIAVFDGEKLTDKIKLSGHPESFQLESAGPRLFVNVPSAHLIEVVDRAKKAVIAKWPVTAAEANFPMALDEANHRLLIACRKPGGKLLAYDTESGKLVAQTDICGDADDVWLDVAARRIYITGGEGFVSVIDQKDPDHYAAAAKIPTAPGARTSFFDRESRRLYVAVPHRDEQRAEIRVFEPPQR